MEKIKIYLQRPWKFSDSPYYDYLTKNVSDKIEYVNINGESQGIVENLGKFRMLNKIKRAIKITLRNILPWMPNAHLTFNSNRYDLIHCAHCLSLNKKPWVCDIEYVNQFWAGGIPRKQKKLILNLLKSENCKKILAWTKWSEKDILDKFPEVAHKIEVVYPAIKIKKSRKIKNKKTRLLFVSRRFYFKGGRHALEVMDRLTKKYRSVDALVISEVPEEVIKEYSNNEKIKFIKFLPKEKLFSEVYPRADIFIYPSYTDTFGFTILEALSFGLPVITVCGPETLLKISRNDIVSHGKTGFVINQGKDWDAKDLENPDRIKDMFKDAIDEMENKVEKLVTNKRLREKFSKNAIQEFKNGRFSVKTRNKELERIYSEALRK